MVDNHISLQEALDIVRGAENNPMSLMDNPRLSQFISDVEDSSMEVLKSKDDSYLMGSIAFIKSCVIAAMVEKCEDPMELIKILGMLDNHTVDIIITIAFKMSVGLSIIEELR